MDEIRFTMNGVAIEARAADLVRFNAALESDDLVLVSFIAGCQLGAQVMRVAGDTIVDRLEVKSDGDLRWLFACRRVALAEAITRYQPDVACTLNMPPSSDSRWMLQVFPARMTVVAQPFRELGVA